MRRYELIFNRSVEEDFQDILSQLTEQEFYYTKVPIAFGHGSSGPRMGDHIWPEENLVYIFYLDEEKGCILLDVIQKLKALFPEEGIKIFSSPAEEH